MPRQQHRQDTGGPESRQSVFGEGVLCNGVDDQAARRLHMRELTTARQAAEQRESTRRASRRAGLESPAQPGEELNAEMARIAAEHQTWLRDHGEDAHGARLRLVEGRLTWVAAPR